MEQTLNQIFNLVTDPYTGIAAWKERLQKKVVGCMPMHLPEELVHAAGLQPVVLWRSNEPVTLGHAHVYTFNCGLTRSVVDDAVKGKLAVLDGIITYDLCLQARELPFIINRNAPPAYLETVYIPGPVTAPVYKDFLLENFRNLKASLEKFSGQTMTQDALRQSIALYNRQRGLLRQLYALRRQTPGLIRAKEMLAIVQSGMLMPKEEHIPLLENLIAELPKRTVSSGKKARVVLSGCMCQTPRFDLLDLIEEEGMAVIDDEIYVGGRYFFHDVAETGDPLEALAERYLNRTIPCPTKVDWTNHWGDYLVDWVGQQKAQGVVTLLVKFCPPHLCYYPDVKKRLANANIPEVMLEVEHEVVSLEQVRTRLQAFVEEIR
ncbi:MAG: 2-hydroxyacyl-CoA dehydratase [Nitrospinae bacterium]|nr:2-hydroxyacyl-CoA dehydratase [Nitrospinota bacterium]